MRTLRELMIAILRQAGGRDGEPFDFCARSGRHREFWEQITKLWLTNGVGPESCADVDVATVMDAVTFDEYLREAAELDSLVPA